MIDRTVKFPQIGNVSSTQSYVLVGANGSGKSHLGAWIEKIMIKFYVFLLNVHYLFLILLIL